MPCFSFIVCCCAAVDRSIYKYRWEAKKMGKTMWGCEGVVAIEVAVKTEHSNESKSTHVLFIDIRGKMNYSTNICVHEDHTGSRAFHFAFCTERESCMPTWWPS